MLKFFPFLFFLLVYNVSSAQFNNMPPGMGQSITIHGKVVDAKTKKGLDAVSVQLLLDIEKSEMPVDSIVGGMFTLQNGDFRFEKVNTRQPLRIEVTAIGYKQQNQKLNLQNLMSVADQSGSVDVGNIAMEIEADVLQNVTVTASRPVLEMGIDRRVFNVEKSITATGGTAIDVMRNIPSVSVDVEGNVLLRNASPQVFIDGRPTILTLDQIPADNIERVELITNPSAKFDASTSGGIINVVLKKNKRIGANGTASVSAGTPNIMAGNLNLNLRQGNFNFFVSGNYNQSGGRADGKTYRTNRLNGNPESYFNQFSWNERIRKFKSLRFGVDYFIDNRNTITVSQNLVDGKFSSDEEQRQEYLDLGKSIERTGLRVSDGSFGFKRSGSQLVYTHKFASPGHQISADVNYNKGNGSNLTFINNLFYNPDGTVSGLPNRVRNAGENNSDQFTGQIDYVYPFSENAKLETGFRTFVQNNTSIFNSFLLDPNGEETKLPLSNHYKYKEAVNALYVTFSNKINSFTYQAGLRGESSDFQGELVDRGQRFGYKYPSKLGNIWDALFPSLFLTQSIGDREDIQLNYSRRIRRPNFRQLNPFIDFNDPVNIQQGNPTLRPEFTNSFEFNYNKNYRSGNLLAALFFRNTVADITQYSDTITAEQYRQLNNAAIDSNAILTTYINSRNQNRLGLDVTWQQNITKSFEIIPNVNMQYRKVNASVNNTDLSNQGFSWEAKLITNYKIDAERAGIFNKMSFQLTGEYESPEVIPQGRRKEQYSVDFALRKDLFKDNKGTFIFSISDLFNTRRWGTIYDTENFYQDSYRRWNVRSFRITFSYKFGDSNFSLFKRQNTSRGTERDEREESVVPQNFN